jgi:transcriptional regulator with GAF, ATPase, and Fis domain
MIRAISIAMMQAYKEKWTFVPRFPGNIRELENIIEHTVLHTF